jgi:Skp family chaperone for outer membrane proteins
MGLLVGGASLIFRHRQLGKALGTLENEKRAIQQQLLDREAKVAALEQDLASRTVPESADRTAELLEEMRRYKAEIRELTLRADDMEVAVDNETADAGAEL